MVSLNVSWVPPVSVVYVSVSSGLGYGLQYAVTNRNPDQLNSCYLAMPRSTGISPNGLNESVRRLLCLNGTGRITGGVSALARVYRSYMALRLGKCWWTRDDAERTNPLLELEKIDITSAACM